MVLHVHPLVVAMVVVFLVSCFLPHGREETGGGSGNFGWFFWEKVAYASAAFVCCNVFRTLCFVTPIAVKEEEEDT
jgi:hypothetical protein